MPTLEERIVKIEKRNTRVEQDKAWETSWVRKATIASLTYGVVVCYLAIVVQNDRPFINAFVPVIGFMLSTMVVGRVRTIWEKRAK